MLNSTLYSSPYSIKNRDSTLFASKIYGAQVSPYKSKVAVLSDKLSQLTIDEEKILKPETYEQRINQIDEKFQKAYENDITRLQSLQKQLNKIEETLENEKIIRNSAVEGFQKTTLKDYELTILHDIQKDKQERKEFEIKLTKQIDEQAYQLRLELARQKQYRFQTEDQYQNDIENKLYNLSQDVMNEKKEREIECQALIQRVGEEVFQVQEMLTQEKKQRQDAQNQMQSMVQEINNILTLQLNEEKVQREETERTMLRLLDETCNRVENSLRR